MKGATVPKPFNLSTGHKREAEELSAYVPMAQQIEQFQKRTPDRYHLRSRKSRDRGVQDVWGARFVFRSGFKKKNKNVQWGLIVI